MHFSVIYSVDCTKAESIRQWHPESRLFQQTEGDEQRQYDYLGGEWVNHKHRKWGALLTRKQFDKFVAKTDLTASSTETMGSLGAPGFGMGWAPAICFESEDQSAIQNAYVTPIPEVPQRAKWPDEAAHEERSWQRLRKAIIKMYS